MLGHDHTKISEQAFVGDKTTTLRITLAAIWATVGRKINVAIGWRQGQSTVQPVLIKAYWVEKLPS